jgi:arylsulfatase A-like enzyme
MVTQPDEGKATSARQKLMQGLSWFSVSVIATAAALWAGGIAESVRAGLDLQSTISAVGFASFLAAIPLLLLVTLVRLATAAWQRRVRLLIDADGSAPRLAAATLIALASVVTVGWIGFQGIWVLFAHTQFRPNVVSTGNGAIVLFAATAVLLVAPFAYEIVRAIFCWMHQAISRRWQRRLFTVPTIAVSAILILAATFTIAKHLVFAKQIGQLDWRFLTYPVAALIALGIAPHVAKSKRMSRVLGATAGGTLVVSVFCAAIFAHVTWRTRSDGTLDIWSDCPISGQAVDKLYDIEQVRSGMSMAAFTPAIDSTPRIGEAPDIILITIDTVRADRMAPYGGPADMPTLRSLAQKGAVFDWAFSTSNVTRRSMPSIFLGASPPRIRGRVEGWALKLDPRHVTLAERLRLGGYQTAGFLCCNSFWGKMENTGWGRGLDTKVIEHNGTKLGVLAAEWLGDASNRKNPGNKPLFMWMHFIDPHNWNEASGSYADEDRRRIYDKSLTAVDAVVGNVLTAYQNAHPGKTPIILITSDHGEGLGDHGAFYHSSDLYNSQTRVPLIVTGPGIAAQRIGEVASGTDVVPTLLGLAGFEPPTGNDIDGRSLADVLLGKRVADPTGGRAYSAMIRDRSNVYEQRSLVIGQWKLYRRNDALELYDVRTDPGERNNQASTQTAKLAEMKRALDEITARDQIPAFSRTRER